LVAIVIYLMRQRVDWGVVALHVVATVLVYNEADIVGQVLDHLREHGISFVVLDGGSQDGSIEIAQGFKGGGCWNTKS
jgi:hypothetical protein